MNDLCSSALAEVGVSLTTLAAKGTATAIANKVKTIKDEKNVEKLRNTYDEVVNEHLAERDEALRIAQAYKSELERIVISDDDINHLHITVSRAIDIFKKFSPETPVSEFESLKDLISVDTLKTMQLLGFNYKAAIGDPLTQICSNAILSWGKMGKNKNNNKR